MQLCVACAIECTTCANACLNEKDLHMLMRCVLLNKDCAALCQVAVGAITNKNPLINQLLELCADMCTACTEECEKHKHEHCKHCAEVCRQCAAECRNAISPGVIG
jgi:hypothetical protein